MTAEDRTTHPDTITNWKQRVGNSFSQASSRYHENAPLQQRVAQQLAEQIAVYCPIPPRRILEIGCGTGLLTTLLAERFPTATIVATDIAPGMVHRCRTHLSTASPSSWRKNGFLCMDGESPAFSSQSFDLVCSSLAFQWFTDLNGAIHALTRYVAPDGQIIFATLAEDTFDQWRAAHARCDLAAGMHAYPSIDTLSKIAPSGWTAAVTEERIAWPYVDGFSFLRELRTLGAATPPPQTAQLSAGQLRRVIRELQRAFPGADAIPITYHVAYGRFYPIRQER